MKTAAPESDASAAPQVAMLRLEAIHESPWNPRKSFDPSKLAELTESVREKGILQPILVRSKPEGLGDGYELVFGARRLRAAKAAQLKTIPAIVRQMGDKEVLEAQVVENQQREDVHPLEEADGYQRLHLAHGYAIEDIAAKVNKSKAYVYGRMKLCELSEGGRQAMLKGELSASVALLVARIPEKLQPDALKRIRSYNGEQLPYREAAQVVQRDFMLRLSEAPFKTDSEDLVEGLGPCSRCPKRTGSQPELFGDVRSPDVCTDPTCYRLKADASWKLRAATAKAAGRQVLSAEETKEVFRYGERNVSYSSDYTELDHDCEQDPKRRTLRKLLGKNVQSLVVLARDPGGGVHELLPKKLINPALRAAGHNFAAAKKAKSAADQADFAKEKERVAKARAAAAVLPAVVAERLAAAIGKKSDGQAWHLVARLLIGDCASNGLLDEFAARRGLTTEDGDANEAACRQLLDARDVPSLKGIVLELVLDTSGNLDLVYRTPETLKTVAEELGVDLEALRREAAALPSNAQAATPAKKRGRR